MLYSSQMRNRNHLGQCFYTVAQQRFQTTSVCIGSCIHIMLNAYQAPTYFYYIGARVTHTCLWNTRFCQQLTFSNLSDTYLKYLLAHVPIQTPWESLLSDLFSENGKQLWKVIQHTQSLFFFTDICWLTVRRPLTCAVGHTHSTPEIYPLDI